MKRTLIDVAGYVLMMGFWLLVGYCLIAWWLS